MRIKKMSRALSLLLVCGLLVTCFAFTTNAANEEVTPSDKNYSVSFTDLIGGIYISNKTSIGTEVGTEYYMTYTVKSVEHKKDYRQHGVIGTNVPSVTYPYSTPEAGKGGLMYYDTKELMLLEGHTYFLKFTITEDGYEYRIGRAIGEDSRYIEFSKTLSRVTTGLGYFGVWFEDTQYESMCGVYMIDEPGVAYYHPQSESWRDLSMQIEASKGLNYVGIVPSINLLPPVTKEDYEPWNRYVKEYIETCEPRYISYDCYPYISYGNKEVYFYSMDRMLSYAKEYNIPFWSYIQVGDESERGSYDIDEGELNWNVNTTLCFGVKGLEYYLVIQPKSMTESYTPGQDYDFQRCGLLGADGSRTQWWYYTQKINEHIRAIDSVLMNSTHKGVIATGESALKLTNGLENMFEGDSWRELKSVEGDVMIGCYNYQGKTALYVTNFEEAYAQKVTLNLHGTYNLSVTQGAELSYIQTNELELDLKAGEGVLVVFD